MSVTLAPGLVGNIFDGIERPLKVLEEKSGAFIERGLNISAVDMERQWDTEICVQKGDNVSAGTIIAKVPETTLIIHKIMVPNGVTGKIIKTAESGKHAVCDVLAVIEDAGGKQTELTMCQTWPIRTARPSKERKPISKPLITGQRVIDTLLPVAKGGTAAVPGGFGTGKTMTQHQLAKWCDADLIVYIGCGER